MIRWICAVVGAAATTVACLPDFEDACGNSSLDIGPSNIQPDGTLPLEGGAALDFDGASASLSYSDTSGDDKCIFDASITLQKGGEFSGCELSIATTPRVDEDGGIIVTRVDLDQTTNCPTWEFEGSATTSGQGPFGVVKTLGSVRGSEVEACYDDVVELHLDRVELETVTGDVVVIGPGKITLEGSFLVSPESASCPTPA